MTQAQEHTTGLQTDSDDDRPHAELRTQESSIKIFDFGSTVPDVTCRFQFKHYCKDDHRDSHAPVWLDLNQVDRLIALLQSAREEMIELERPMAEPY